ncbi:MAG TPA: hypothetical protein ENK21_06780 [Trueperaceae bacterium]|nr:hypothetical protein [Trueperaceae bacterium]
MTLSKVKQAKLDGLNAIANALFRTGTDPKLFKSIMSADIVKFEKETNLVTSFEQGQKSGIWFRASEGDYARVRTSKARQVRYLRARIDGVVISINLHKAGSYSHNNNHVSGVLKDLARAIANNKNDISSCDCDIEV